MPVRQILALLMILFLASGQSVAAAGAVCRHGSYEDHLSARASADVRVASVAMSEESAASVMAKKTGSSASPSVDVGAEGPAAPALPYFATASVIPYGSAESDFPSGQAVRPLLEPPAYRA